MGKLGLKCVSSGGVRGTLYFYIMSKSPGRNGGMEFTIQVQELLHTSTTEIPIYIFSGYYSSHKGIYTLYPKKHLNHSLLEFQFRKLEIDAQFVYDVSAIETHLPPELRLHDMRPVSESQSLEEIFG